MQKKSCKNQMFLKKLLISSNLKAIFAICIYISFLSSSAVNVFQEEESSSTQDSSFHVSLKVLNEIAI